MSGSNKGDIKAIERADLPDVSAIGIKIFCYLCENHGVTISRIAKDLSLAESMVRRALSELGEEVGEGLSIVDGSGFVRLTALGCRIRDG